LIIAGRKDRTPTGVFPIFKRVESEIMDSSTVGFPPGHPEHYLIKNVAHAQYFTGAGHAIHGNYWVHPSRFGQFLSNGCIGLRNHDAAWVWSLTQAGTIIHIHY
jgi:lipoprotein-anchoring transpeptidase ErfK/SrfK